MATQAVTVVDQNNGQMVWTWGAAANADVGATVNVGRVAGLTFQVKGTLGVAGSLSLEGSNDGGTTWAVLKDDSNTAITLTALGIVTVRARPMLFRVHSTAGDGTTALVGILSGTRSN